MQGLKSLPLWLIKSKSLDDQDQQSATWHTSTHLSDFHFFVLGSEDYITLWKTFKRIFKFYLTFLCCIIAKGLYFYLIRHFVLLPFATFQAICNSIFPELTFFEQRPVSGAFYSLSGNLIFSQWEFIKTKTNGHPKVQCVVNTADKPELPRQTVTNFYLIPKETCGLALSWWKVMHFLLTNSRCFSSSGFSWSNWEQYLLELIFWFSTRSSK